MLEASYNDCPPPLFTIKPARPEAGDSQGATARGPGRAALCGEGVSHGSLLRMAAGPFIQRSTSNRASRCQGSKASLMRVAAGPAEGHSAIAQASRRHTLYKFWLGSGSEAGGQSENGEPWRIRPLPLSLPVQAHKDLRRGPDQLRSTNGEPFPAAAGPVPLRQTHAIAVPPSLLYSSGPQGPEAAGPRKGRSTKEYTSRRHLLSRSG
jgi:hypothetical protein